MANDTELEHLIAPNVTNNIVIRSGVEIVSMKDGIETEYLGGISELMVKVSEALGEVARIRYRVTGEDQRITLWIEYDSNSSPHDNFYRSFSGRGISPPQVAILVNDELRSPGEFEVNWDGRDQSPDRRILLAGEYKVKVKGIDSTGRNRENESTFRIAPPDAWNFGIHYRKGSFFETTKAEVEHAEASQKSLKDGTAYSSATQLANTAVEAVEYWQSSAIVYWSGHSNPRLIVFYDGEGDSFRNSKESFLTVTQELESPNATLAKLPDAAFKDLFLLVLAGCRTGNEIFWIQSRLNQLSEAFNPGPVDGKHGDRTTNALRKWQKWEKIEPNDGQKNPVTLSKMGIDPAGLSEEELTRRVQRKLKEISRKYNPGPRDGIYGDKTELAIRNYQEDHPPLDPNGLPDEPTVDSLRIEPEEARNIAEEAIRLGCNLSFGFDKKVGFLSCERMMIAFWDNLAQGMGIQTAAEMARSKQPLADRTDLVFKIYHREGVSENSTLHPARYGKST